ncbi:MAG: hypothetical protein JXQ73_16780 [Phycisphaerae bacterium]|nr:hypothetical protein [Phycisphaerae bacterium]
MISLRSSMPRALGSLWLPCVCLCVTVGCVKPWRPPIERVERENVPDVPRVGDYAPDEDGWRWVYARRREGAVQPSYVRELRDGVYVDGTLDGRPFLPIVTYLQDPNEAVEPSPRRKSKRKRAPLGGALGVLITFDPPLTPLPARLRVGDTVDTDAQLTCQDERGRKLYDGAARRSVLLEGLEDVRAGGRRFAKCLRLCVRTRLHLHWGPAIHLTQYVWLARGVGEVRRVERVTGWVFLLPFSATESFELIDVRRPPARTTQAHAQPEGFRRWARMALEFTQTLPSPELGGMRIELAPPDEAATPGGGHGLVAADPGEVDASTPVRHPIRP